MTAASPGTAALAAAASAKKEQKYRDAKAAITALHKEGAAINFRTVSQRAKVSTNYLYGHPELNATIRRLRTPATAGQPLPPDPSQQGGVVAVLRARLKVEQARNQELRQQIKELEGQIEALVGKLITNRT